MCISLANLIVATTCSVGRDESREAAATASDGGAGGAVAHGFVAKAEGGRAESRGRRTVVVRESHPECAERDERNGLRGGDDGTRGARAASGSGLALSF